MHCNCYFIQIIETNLFCGISNNVNVLGGSNRPWHDCGKVRLPD